MAIAPVNKFISLAVPVAPGMQELYEVPTGTSALLLYAQVAHVGAGNTYPTVTFIQRRESRSTGNTRDIKVIEDVEIPPNDAVIIVDGRMVLEKTPLVLDKIFIKGTQQNVGIITNVAYHEPSGIATVTTAAAHKLTTGQMITVTGGSWQTNASGHLGTHHITRVDADTFTFTVSTSRTPTGNFTVGSPAAAYTTFAPQGIVVEWDATNKILFYVQNVYANQGTDATWKQTIPFSGNSTITGDTSEATGVPHVASSATVNNTVFVAGYANPELQPDSGDIIYIENRKPISRASDQTEDVKLVVEF